MTSTAKDSNPESDIATLGAVFGEVVGLFLASAKHRSLFLSDLEWALLPPLTLGQFRLFRRGEKGSAGCALWAYLDEESERHLNESGRLRPSGWKSGDRLWLVEMICPFGGEEAMLSNLKQTVFVGKDFSYHVTGSDGVRKVVKARGDDMSSDSEGNGDGEEN